MGNRIELHNILLTVLPNVYFQPPNSLKMSYPCIVYKKSGVHTTRADNMIYNKTQEYQITIIDKNPDNTYADTILQLFSNVVLTGFFIFENLNHTTLNLYF